jgi:hypothetical protein
MTTLAAKRSIAAVMLSTVLAMAAASSVAGSGHLSLDSVQHVYEASVGRSVSTQPPAVAAYLSWLGGATTPDQAVRRLLALSGLATFLGLLLPLAARPEALRSRAWLPVVVATPWSPLLLLYAGILWKDVVFGAVMTFALGSLAFLRLHPSPRRHVTVLVLSAVLVCFAVLSTLRPQAWLLLPLIAAASAWGRSVHPWRAMAAGVVAGVVAAFSLSTAVERTIGGHDGRSTRASMVNLVRFDLAGIERFSGAGTLVALGVPREAAAEAGAHYAPDRGDGLGQAKAYVDWLRAQSTAALATLWVRALAAEPRAYAAHRIEAARWLWGTRDPRACLPLHLGVEGLPAQTDALSLRTGLSARDQALFAALQPWLTSAVFRPVTYAAALCLVAILVVRRNDGEARTVAAGLLAVGAAYGGATTIVSFACDLRYLYPLVPLVSLAGVVAAFRWSPSRVPERAISPAQANR